MSTPAKSFDNLRSILGKLDRKIDKARSKRLGLDDAPSEQAAAVEREIGRDESLGVKVIEDQQADQTVVGDPRHRSPFGRAKPLNRNGSTSQSNWIGGAGTG